ncbi:MAG: hypothetical protein AAB557_02325 [Patescibacteria group bacterium]
MPWRPGCPSDVEERLVGQGIFVAGSFLLQRDLESITQNDTTAAELFLYNPRLLIAMPDSPSTLSSIRARSLRTMAPRFRSGLRMRDVPITWPAFVPRLGSGLRTGERRSGTIGANTTPRGAGSTMLYFR